MSRTIRVNATMDDALVARVDADAERHYEDRSTALRQLADFALRKMARRLGEPLQVATATPS